VLINSPADINRWLSLLCTLPIPYVSNRYDSLILIPIYLSILQVTTADIKTFHVKNILNLYHIWYVTTITDYSYYYAL
jgi:hypothetical protein